MYAGEALWHRKIEVQGGKLQFNGVWEGYRKRSGCRRKVGMVLRCFY